MQALCATSAAMAPVLELRSIPVISPGLIILTPTGQGQNLSKMVWRLRGLALCPLLSLAMTIKAEAPVGSRADAKDINPEG